MVRTNQTNEVRKYDEARYVPVSRFETGIGLER